MTATHIKKSLLLCVGLVLGPLAHAADVYTWVDDNGVRHYSDTAQVAGAKKADLPGIQAIQGDDSALAFAQKQAQAKSHQAKADNQPTQPPQITSPNNKSTFRDANGRIPVSVSLGPNGLANGQSLTYRVDGKETDFSPTTQTTLSLNQIERGAHTLSVAITRRGKTLARSRPVTFYQKPPGAISPLSGRPNNLGAPVAPGSGSAPGVGAAPSIGNISAGRSN